MTNLNEERNIGNTNLIIFNYIGGEKVDMYETLKNPRFTFCISQVSLFNNTTNYEYIYILYLKFNLPTISSISCFFNLDEFYKDDLFFII